MLRLWLWDTQQAKPLPSSRACTAEQHVRLHEPIIPAANPQTVSNIPLMARFFITGSSDGLGSLTAKRLVAQGHQVVLHARNPERARDASAACPGAEAVLVADLSSIDETRTLAAAAGWAPMTPSSTTRGSSAARIGCPENQGCRRSSPSTHSPPTC